MTTLKQLGKRLKKANRFLAVTKNSQIEAYRNKLVEVIATRQDPKNAIRSCIPKKKQRELGMLPPVNK